MLIYCSYFFIGVESSVEITELKTVSSVPNYTLVSRKLPGEFIESLWTNKRSSTSLFKIRGLQEETFDLTLTGLNLEKERK